MARNSRDVELVIRAKDQAKSALEAVSNALAGLADQSDKVEAASRSTDSALDRLGAAFKLLQKQVRDTQFGTKLADDFRKAQAAISELTAAQSRASADMGRLASEARKAARDTAAFTAEAERLEAALSGQGAAVSRAKAAQDQLNAATAKAAADRTKLVTAEERLTAQMQEAKAAYIEAGNRYRKLGNDVTQAEKPTKRMISAWQASERALDQATRRFFGLRDTLGQVQTALAANARFVGQVQDRFGGLARSVDAQVAAYDALKVAQAENAAAMKEAARAQNRLSAEAERAGDAYKKASADVAEARKDFAQLTETVRESEIAMRRLQAQAKGDFTSAYRQQGAIVRGLGEAFNAASAQAAEMEAALRSVRKPTAEQVNAFARLIAETEQLQAALQESRRIFFEMGQIARATGGDLAALTVRQEQLSRLSRESAAAISTLAAAQRGSAASGQAATRGTLAQVQALERLGLTARKASDGFDGRRVNIFSDAIREFYGESRTALSYTQRLRSEVLSLIAAYGGFFAVVEGIRNVVNAYQSLETAQQRLASVFQGDKLAVADELDFIRRNANRLGIEFGSLTDLYSRFAVATRGTILEGDATRKIFISVAEAGRVQRLTLEQLKGTFYALEQIASKGNVTMEELRQQLGDRLPGAVQILADALNVTVPELNRMVEAGAVGSEALIAFAEELDRRYGSQLPEALQSTAAAVGKLQNTVTQAFLKFAKAGFIDAFTGLVRDLDETLKSAQFESFLRKLSAGMAALTEVVAFAARNFDILVIAISAFIGTRLAPFVIAIVNNFGQMRTAVIVATGSIRGMTAAMLTMNLASVRAVANVKRLTVALRALLGSTGIGILVTAIATGIGIWATRTDDATEVLHKHLELVDRVKDAYDATGGALDKIRDKLKSITAVELTAQLRGVQKALRKLTREFYEASLSGERFDFTPESAPLVDALVEGRINAEKFREEIDKLFKGGFISLDTANDLVEISRRFEDLRKAGQDLADIQKILFGTQKEGAAAAERLAGGVKKAVDPIKAAAEAAARFEAALDELRSQIPSVEAELERFDAIAAIEKNFQNALAAARALPDAIMRIAAAQRALDARELALAEADADFIGDAAGGDLVSRIIAAESSRNPNAKNSNSSALGLGQFIESTWLRLFRKYFPERASALTREAILELRKDADLSRKMVELYMRENAAHLRRAGQEINNASLYLAHFLGPGGAVKVLAADPNTPVAQLLSAQQIAANPTVLGGGRTAGDVLRFAEGKVGVDPLVVEAEEQIVELLDEEAEKRAEALKATQEQLAALGVEIDMQRLKNAGQDREAFILEGIAEAREKNVQLSAQDEALLREKLGTLYDLQAAEKAAKTERERAQEIEEGVNALLERRTLLQERLDTAVNRGLGPATTSPIGAQIDAVEAEIAAAVDEALKLLSAFDRTDATIRNIILRLQNLKFESQAVAQGVVIDWTQVADQFSTGMANAVDEFIGLMVEGASVSEAARQAFLRFASDFLRQIAQMILQQLIFNAVRMAMASAGIPVPVAHSGGIAGHSTGRSRRVDPILFSNAMRMHSGGIAGLRPNEVPMILQRNEEVLAADSPRNILNGGAAAGRSDGGTRVVNAVDGTSFLEQALRTTTGERLILNFIRANPSAVRQALGV